MIWRDDDPGLMTNVDQFVFVHQIFQRYKVRHTVALIMKDIEKNRPLVDYILQNKSEFDLQLHCWEHVDFVKSVSIADDFDKSVKAMLRIFNVIPTVWYPPWNSTNSKCNEVAAGFGLKARPDKISLDQYVRKNGAVAEDTVNFHYWYDPEIHLLYKALEIYTKSVVT